MVYGGQLNTDLLASLGSTGSRRSACPGSMPT
jgi:hypothetical protein